MPCRVRTEGVIFAAPGREWQRFGPTWHQKLFGECFTHGLARRHIALEGFTSGLEWFAKSLYLDTEQVAFPRVVRREVR